MREKFSPSLFQKAGGVWGNAPHKQTDKSKFEVRLQIQIFNDVAELTDARDVVDGLAPILAQIGAQGKQESGAFVVIWFFWALFSVEDGRKRGDEVGELCHKLGGQGWRCGQLGGGRIWRFFAVRGLGG